MKVEHDLITPNEYDQLNTLVRAYSATKPPSEYKCLYCFRCHAGQLHEKVDDKWRCCNCGMRRGDEFAEDEPDPKTGPCPLCAEVQTPLGDPCPKCDAAIEQSFERMAEGTTCGEPDPY